MQSGIIVADDDVVVRGLLRSVLMSIGQDVFMTSSGEEALVVAVRMRAVLILLDLNMRRLNGLLTCERLRVLPGYVSTPIVILTAYANEDARNAASRVGATAFMAKPFQPASLLAAVAPYLAAKSNLVQHHRTNSEAEPSRPGNNQRASALDRGKSILDVYRG